MRKFVCTLMIAMLTLTPVIPTQRAEASGFPVVDIAHIAQAITGYIQELADYVEALQQTALSTSQFAQMLTDYTQVLQEYEHYLDQIRQLQDVISADQWDELMSEIERQVGEVSDITLTDMMDPSDEDYEADLREILDQQGLAVARPAEAVAAFEELGGDPAALEAWEGRMEQRDEVYRRYAAQHETAALIGNDIEDLQVKIDAARGSLGDLGEQSDLATLQFIAMLQTVQLEQQRISLELQNKELQLYEPPSLRQAVLENEAIDRELLRLQGALGGEIETQDIQNFADFFNGDADEE